MFKNNNISKKHWIIFLILSLVLTCLFCSGIYAYYTDNESVTNKISIGGSHVSVQEAAYSAPVPGKVWRSNIAVKNEGPSSCYVRAKFMFTDGSMEQYFTVDKNESDWTYKAEDGYYYCSNVLDNGESTTALVDSITANADTDSIVISSASVIVYAESYQSEPFADYVAAWDYFKRNRPEEPTAPEIKIPIIAAGTSWYKGTTSKSSITAIDMVDWYTSTGNEIESWDASDARDGSVMCYVEGTKLTIAGNGYGNIVANKNSSSMFNNFSEITNINGLNIFTTINVTDMSYMFAGCKSLTSLDIRGFNTSAVTSMRGMFNNLTVTNLDVSGFDTSSVTDMRYMFNNLPGLTNLDVSGFDTSSVTDMSGMFCCGSLTSLDISQFDTSKVTSISSFIYDCRKLTTITFGPNFNKTESGMFFVFGSTSTIVNGAAEAIRNYNWTADNRTVIFQ